MSRPEPWYSVVSRETGMSERTVQRYARIGNNLDKTAADILRGTPFENKLGELDELSRQAPDRQQRIAVLLTRSDSPAPSVAAAIAVLDGGTPDKEEDEGKTLRLLTDRWARLPKTARRAWVMALPPEQAVELASLLAERGY